MAGETTRYPYTDIRNVTIRNVTREKTLNRIILERIKYWVQVRMPLHQWQHMTLELWTDTAAQALVADLYSELYVKKESTREVNHKTYRWPATWWEAFKCEYFPAWLLRRRPIRYHEQSVAVELSTTIYRICPHVSPTESRHIEFLSQ